MFAGRFVPSGERLVGSRVIDVVLDRGGNMRGVIRCLWPLSGVLMLLCAMYCCASPLAFATPDERTFELVSPAYKGGYGATHIEAVALNGDSVAFYSPGVFEGAPAGLSENVDSLDYLSRREATGWSTVPVMPPDELLTYVFDRDISQRRWLGLYSMAKEFWLRCKERARVVASWH